MIGCEQGDTKNVEESGTRKQIIWQTVCAIPQGKVATYGQVAELAGLKGMARYVGFALASLAPGSDVPWHRVVNAQGRISFAEFSAAAREQTERLRAEGVEVNQGRIALRQYRWSNPD